MSRILLTGSSIFEQWENAAQAAPEHDVVNRAVGGTTTACWMETLAAVLRTEQPDILWMYCGSNDLCAEPIPEDIADNVIACRRIAARHSPILRFAYFSIIKAPQKKGLWNLIDGINHDIHLRLSPGDLFVDLNRLFFADGAPVHDLFIEDGLHHHTEAYRQMADRVRPVIKEWLNG